jgi:hypothetical protein
MKATGTLKVPLCVTAMSAAIFALAACGGGGSSSPTSTPVSRAASPAAAATTGGGADEAAVKAALNSELAAYQKKDWQAAYKIASPRFQTTCSLDQFVAAVGGNDFSTMTVTNIKVRIEGDKAYVTDTVTINGKDDTTATDAAPEIYVKVGGKWYDDSKGQSGCS